ncbi:MAG TPA: hypothetical protein VIP46_11030, partial [Pyrinomonadaceae bacterium]
MTRRTVPPTVSPLTKPAAARGRLAPLCLSALALVSASAGGTPTPAGKAFARPPASKTSAPPLRAARQNQNALTPVQREIEKQRARLSSSDAEERRDAVTRLGAMRRPDASRAAAQ